MARSIVSFGILPALASLMALRRRALASGSPPPERAATVISLINFVNSLPRLASSAPFLCLILCHFECRAIGFDPSEHVGCRDGNISQPLRLCVSVVKESKERSTTETQRHGD